MRFVDELITNTFTYEPYDGFCPDFSVFFNKMKYLENHAELNPRPHPPIKGCSRYFPSYD